MSGVLTDGTTGTGMGNEFKGRVAHSAEHFGDARDHWWNFDFLRLMAKRWRLDAVRDVLDVGCGVGHWSMLLAAVMPEDARVIGIDREPSWVEEATARAVARGLDGRFSYQHGVAEHLPFRDNSFDLTTCQTLLIHVPDPGVAIAEMIRVTKPGGLVAVAEPNNLAEALLLDSVANRLSTDEIVERVRFQLTCERGKVALGEGDNSLGDQVPGLFVAQGLEQVEAHVNDKATAVSRPTPPTRIEHSRTTCVTASLAVSAVGTRPKRGGSEVDFAAHFARGLASGENVVRALDDSTYHGISGGPFYLVAGRKSEAAR